ncbi:MAG: porin family protein [bacterium]|nr:porin family protein [bacterium]
MMKKISICAVLLMLVQLVFAASPQESKKFSLTANVGVRNFTETLFKDIYSDTPITFGVDLAYRVLEPLEIFFHTDLFSIDGKLTFTEEPTTLKITPLELGGRYLLSTKNSKNQKFFPYVGAGAGYYMIKEDNAIGNLDEKRVGFFAEGGFRFYVAGSIFVDLKLKNVFVKSESGVNVGGFSYMGGVGISF